MNILSKQFVQAKKEGRICRRCGWMITKINWKKGYLLCAGCWDALKGVSIDYGHWQPQQEVIDQTGEML
jgi:hypothetical protein